MAEQSRPQYDLFVSYAPADQEWVKGYLLDALEQAGVRMMSEEAFQLGVPRLAEFERAVTESARVLLVLSPAFLAEGSAQFVELLAESYGQETASWPVIPLLLRSCDLPVRLKMLTRLDATDEAGWEAAVARLCAELQRPVPEAAPPPECPYPGMKPFAEQDSSRFFGRGAEVEQMLKALRKHPFLAVIGPSGSGKSSAVFAGLIPALRRSRLFGLGEWTVRKMRPGADPMAALQSALTGLIDLSSASPSRLAPTPFRLLLVVDQLEELFSAAKEAVDSFAGALLRLAQLADCYVIPTVRADFYPELMACPLWSEVQAHRIEVLPLREDGLREAIVRPAEGAGVYVDAALVERLVADAAGEPGILPFVQETLVLLWEKVERRFLPLRAYEALVLPRAAYGAPPVTGLQVAMADHADAVLAELPEAEQALARRTFLRLVQFGEGRADTRRQQPVPALNAAGDDPAAFERTLEHLAASRLLTLSGAEGEERRADIAHEALIRGWPALQGWISERRGAEATRRRLEEKAVEWVRLGRGAGGLLDEVELTEAERWLGSEDSAELGAGLDLQALAQTSRAALEQQRLEKEAVQRRELEQAQALAVEQARRLEEVQAERDRAEQRRIRAEVAEKRAAAERSYARAERNRALAGRVALQFMRPDRQRYETTLLHRATEFESKADAQWNAAYALERTLGPIAGPGRSGEALAEPRSGMFDLDVITALRRSGCFIVRYGGPATPRLLIVEGGDQSAYAKGLKARLTTLREQILPGAPLPVELAIVTHYDMDRVGGIAKLFEELKEAHDAGLPPLATIKSVWFNHFLPEDMDKAKKGPVPPGMNTKDQIPRLASALGIGLNEPFDYFVMASERGPTQVTLAEGMRATVVAPDAAWLQKWYANWRTDKAKRLGEVGDDLVQQTRLEPSETDLLEEAVSAISEGFSSPEIELLRAPADVLALPAPAPADMSAANLSSIVTLLEFGGRRMLFCGDSRCDHIARGLSQAGLLPPDGQLHLDVMQVPHAGSRNNVTTLFFERVTADHYVIVPNSLFKLPDVKTLEMIVNARGDAQYEIHLPALAPMIWLDTAKWSARLLQRAAVHDNDTFTVSVPSSPT